MIQMQKVNLRNVTLKGRILDIGGGGEGIIGQLKKERVVAIDPSERELRETKSGGLKIVMDARILMFLDRTFDTVTAFFTMMYIPRDDHERVFKEVHRVLKKNGRFVIWDVMIPRMRKNQKKDIFAVPLTIHMPGERLRTCYGVPWHKLGLNLQYFIELGERIGFAVTKVTERKSVYYIRMKKDNSEKMD